MESALRVALQCDDGKKLPIYPVVRFLFALDGGGNDVLIGCDCDDRRRTSDKGGGDDKLDTCSCDLVNSSRREKISH